jgi:type IV fimbrial biogenesis protein FimT
MKYGFTLVEVALVLAVAGLLLGVALPSFSALKQGIRVESAAQDIAAAHRRARATAIVHGRAAILSVSARTLRITFAGAERPHWMAPGPSESGVTLASPARDLTFSPLGITTGLSNASFHLTVGSAARTVVVSRLGRVRITRSP